MTTLKVLQVQFDAQGRPGEPEPVATYELAASEWGARQTEARALLEQQKWTVCGLNTALDGTMRAIVTRERPRRPGVTGWMFQGGPPKTRR